MYPQLRPAALVQQKNMKVFFFCHRVEEAGTSPVKFDHSFKVSHSLPPAVERHVDQTAVQECTQVFCTVIDENYNTHTHIQIKHG